MKRDTTDARNALACIVCNEAGRAQLARILRRAKALHESTREAVAQARRTEARLTGLVRGGQRSAPELP